jgi:hypothetical protein
MTTIAVTLDEKIARQFVAQASGYINPQRSLRSVVAAIEAALPKPIDWHTYGDVIAVAEMDGRVAIHYLSDHSSTPMVCYTTSRIMLMTVEEAEHWLRTGEVPA